MGLVVRPPEPHEAEAALACSEAAYGLRYPPELRARLLERLEGGAFRCAIAADGELVGVAAAYELELTVPGPALLPVVGWSEIAVLPTARRRGVLRALLASLRAEAVAAGRAGVVLYASEGGIYGRFGFAPACAAARYRLDLARTRLREGVPPAGQVRLLRADEAASALPAVFDLARRACPGELDRGPGTWRDLLAGGARSGAARFACAYEEDGQVEGYAVYDIGPEASDGSGRELELVELVGLEGAAEAALWAYLLGTDLVERVVTSERPVDEPLRHLLEDPRSLETTSIEDLLWLQVLDPVAALSARRYAAGGSLVLEVAPVDAMPVRLLLEVEESGAAVARATSAPAELALDGAALAAAYLGGTSLGALARAGRVEERRAGALRRAIGLFAVGRAPFCTADV